MKNLIIKTYNFLIDILTILIMVGWVLSCLTIIVPLFVFMFGGDYFYFKSVIKDMELNKIDNAL